MSKRIALVGALAVGSLLIHAVSAQTPSVAVPPSSQGRVTADDQGNNPRDLALTQQIRKSVIADKSLSMSAHNVQIVSTEGTVTLSGTVAASDEKEKVVAIASQVAGADHIVDRLTIAASK